MISVDDFVMFCDRTLDGYVAAIERLDDTTVTTRPTATNGSTPYQLVTHAIGACHWWTAHHVAGRDVERDRPAEFEAHGSVADAFAQVGHFRQTLAELAPALRSASTVYGRPSTQTPLQGEWTVGACLIHAYEELAQHLGHLEITVDLLTS